jgi:endonuclease YncB( thermonuclease family)
VIEIGRRVRALTPSAWLVAAALALAGAGCRDDNTTADVQPTGSSGTVARVDDGDTVTLASGARVRLLQIDAPELTTDCYGREALEELVALTPPGTRVRLVADPGLDDHDRYGRLLRYVVVGDTDVNVALVRRGAASPYFFHGERGRHANELLEAVEAARGERRGYWGVCPDARLNTGLGSITGPA